MLSKAFRQSNLNKTRTFTNFTDISNNYWAYSYIKDAYELGFLNPFSGNQFNPNQKMTRLDMGVA